VFSRRTVDVDGAADPLIRSLGSHSVTLNTEDVSGYQQPRTGGFVVTCQGANGDLTCNGQRQVAITGAHYRGHSGRADWDHTVSTDEPLIIQGQGAARRVVSGKVRVQHNIAEYTTVTTIVEPLVHQWGCCLPVGGKVITAFFGGKRDGKTEVLSFGPKCGESTLEDLDHKRTGLLLRHCL
jgi:hypothetical protein